MALTTTGEGSALVAGSDGQQGKQMAVNKGYYTALRGFRANIYDSVEEQDQRHQFRAVAAGEVVILTAFEAMGLIFTNKAAKGEAPAPVAEVAPPAPPVPPEPTTPPEPPAPEAQPAAPKRGKANAEQ